MSLMCFSLNFIIGGIIGGFILTWRLVVAVWYILNGTTDFYYFVNVFWEFKKLLKNATLDSTFLVESRVALTF